MPQDPAYARMNRIVEHPTSARVRRKVTPVDAGSHTELEGLDAESVRPCRALALCKYAGAMRRIEGRFGYQRVYGLEIH